MSGLDAATIADRLQRGQLARDRVELAAYCGLRAAREVLGKDSPKIPGDTEDWALGLARWGQEACVRVMHAAADFALRDEERHLREDPKVPADVRAELLAVLGPVRAALDAVADWLRRPGELRADQVRALLGVTEDAADTSMESWGCTSVTALADAAVWTVRGAALQEADLEPGWTLGGAAAEAAAEALSSFDDPEQADSFARALEESFFPWALG